MGEANDMCQNNFMTEILLNIIFFGLAFILTSAVNAHTLWKEF
jgi:hypothetical protein